MKKRNNFLHFVTIVWLLPRHKKKYILHTSQLRQFFNLIIQLHISIINTTKIVFDYCEFVLSKFNLAADDQFILALINIKYSNECDMKLVLLNLVILTTNMLVMYYRHIFLNRIFSNFFWTWKHLGLFSYFAYPANEKTITRKKSDIF